MNRYPQMQKLTIRQRDQVGSPQDEGQVKDGRAHKGFIKWREVCDFSTYQQIEELSCGKVH